jgi:hypothetical protein
MQFPKVDPRCICILSFIFFLSINANAQTKDTDVQSKDNEVHTEKPDNNIGISDLPGQQNFPLYSNLPAFRYSLVNSQLQGIEVIVSETPDRFFIDNRRIDLENFEMEILLYKFQNEAGEYARALKDFIIYANNNYMELNEKDQAWWEDKLESLGVDPPEGGNSRDYFRAIEDQYGLSNKVIEAISHEYYGEEFPELIEAYTLISKLKASREDTLNNAREIRQIADNTGVSNIETQSWLGMLMTLEDFLAKKFSHNQLSWALRKVEDKLKPLSLFTFTTDKEGVVSKAEFLSPSNYRRLKISYEHLEDSTIIALSHPSQKNEKQSYEIGRGITDIHFLLTLIPWYNFSENSNRDYYLLDTKGSRYGGHFSVEPVFHKVNLQKMSEEKISLAGKEIDTYKVRLSFSNSLKRPVLFFNELSYDDRGPVHADIWLSKISPHIPLKVKLKNQIYWQGPDTLDPEGSVKWYDWMEEDGGKD